MMLVTKQAELKRRRGGGEREGEGGTEEGREGGREGEREEGE